MVSAVTSPGPPIQMGNSHGENTFGHHFKSGACNTGSYVMTW